MIALLNIRAFILSLINNLLFSLGTLWAIVEPVSYFASDNAGDKIKSLWWLFLLGALVMTIYKSWPKTKFLFQLCNRDVQVEVTITDIWKTSGCIIIPVNNRMTVNQDGNILDSGSILCQLIQRFYDNKPETLQHEIDKILQAEYYASRVIRPGEYKMGTMVQVGAGGRKFYLVVNTTLNNFNRSHSTKENLDECLNEMWYYLSEGGLKADFVIPLLGTGKGRIDMSRFEVYKEILLSFIASCSGKTYCDKLTICIHKSDVKNHRIDINKIVTYTAAKVEYAEFKLRDNQRSGNIINA